MVLARSGRAERPSLGLALRSCDMALLGRYVIARENNVVLVNFRRDPDPPAPRFPGAGALRLESEIDDPEQTSVMGQLAS
jgi:hypothetical protein